MNNTEFKKIQDIKEIEYSDEYIKKMQKEGLFDAMNHVDPEFPDCQYYMEAYKSI
jgi:hypothetical protein